MACNPHCTPLLHAINGADVALTGPKEISPRSPKTGFLSVRFYTDGPSAPRCNIFGTARSDFAEKMAEVLSVYRQVKVLKWGAHAKDNPSDGVAIISYDEKPSIQAIATTARFPPSPENMRRSRVSTSTSATAQSVCWPASTSSPARRTPWSGIGIAAANSSNFSPCSTPPMQTTRR